MLAGQLTALGCDLSNDPPLASPNAGKLGAAVC